LAVTLGLPTEPRAGNKAVLHLHMHTRCSCAPKSSQEQQSLITMDALQLRGNTKQAFLYGGNTSKTPYIPLENRKQSFSHSLSRVLL